jgi:hypothetical protein
LLLRFEDMQRHAEGIAAVIPNYAEMQIRLSGGRHRIAIRMPQQVRRFYGKGSTIE